ISYNQFTEPGSATIDGEEIKYWAELIKAKEAEIFAKYEHKYWGEYAGITHNKFGKGDAWYIGCYTSKEELKKVYKKAFDISEDLPEWPVIVRNGINPSGEKLHFIFNYSQNEESIICKYDKAMNIFDEKTYVKGDKISLRDYDLVVLKEV
nr:beta-galactosidase trimerization domain-containing protein [Butyrivibrio sp.]